MGGGGGGTVERGFPYLTYTDIPVSMCQLQSLSESLLNKLFFLVLWSFHTVLKSTGPNPR